MSKVDRKYLDIIEDIFLEGQDVQTRNSIVRKKFNITTEYTSTPLVSIRRTAWKQSLLEFEWFLSGSDNITTLNESVKHWWKPWANSYGFIPNNYSTQFRKFSGSPSEEYITPKLDQIAYLIKEIKNNPQSRRQVITTWNTCDMASKETPIANCHGSMIQTDINPETKELNLFMYQRSCDVMMGLPHNLLQYYAFLLYLAHQTGYKPGKFIHTLGNAHIYEAHMEVANLCRHTEISHIETPELTYNPTSDNFKADDFKLVGEYKPIIKEKLELIV